MSRGVAIDVGPLVGPRTGVGEAVSHLLTAFEELPDPPELHPYVLSFRAQLPAGTRRLRYPAALAHRLWARMDLPDATRALGRPALVHGTNYVVPPARCPRLVSVYDCWFLRHPEDVHPDVARAAAVLRRAVARGAVVHVSSRATADEVHSLMAPARVEVVHLGASPVAPPPASPPELVAERIGGRPYVLALSTVERRKNLYRLVDAFGRLHAIHPELLLVIAGRDGNGTPDVAASVFRLTAGAAASVVRLGQVDDDTKSWLLHNASVLAYPSLDEGFGFPLLEAMSADVPVVASTAGSIPEVTGGAALLVDPLDVDGLAAAIERVLTDDRLHHELVTTGRARVARFSWRAAAKRMADLYASLAMEGTTG
ncbi:MAG: glycosyltransferase family 4 protein [Acidimicrobiia bacterium]